MELCTRSGPTPGVVGQRNLIDEMQRVIFFFVLQGFFYKVKGIEKR